MKKHLLRFSCLFLICIASSGCFNLNYRRLLTDEVVLKDGNSLTGTIQKCDSAHIRIKRIDESMINIPWSEIDTVQGKKLKTFFFGLNTGIYKTPYFSIFRNEAFTPTSGGFQLKGGFAYRANKLTYLHLTIIPAQPYGVTKFGLGYACYLGQTTYLKKNSFMVGSEANLMGVKQNNGPQFVFEPFTGFEHKLNEKVRVNVKLGMQFNFSNKNNQTGVNLTVGIHFLNRNFKRYYETLNHDRKLPHK
ncbi:MAG: hypothetical protein ACJ77K_01295 [Bacteroidia bacterium]|jgi:hypothetical protein